MNPAILIYPYLVDIHCIELVIDTLSLPFSIVKELHNADAILAIRSRVKQSRELRIMARSKNITIYTIFTSSLPHITRALRKILALQVVSKKIRFIEII